MSDTIYPELNEKGKIEYQKLIDNFKLKMNEICESTMSELYCDVGTHIESDSWTNFRNGIIDGLKGYPTHLKHNFKEIRDLIFKENKEEIIKDIKEDFLEEIDSLKKTIEFLRHRRH